MLLVFNIIPLSECASQEIYAERFKQSPSLCTRFLTYGGLSSLSALFFSLFLLSIPPSSCFSPHSTSSLSFYPYLSLCPLLPLFVLGELYFLATGTPSARARGGVIYKIVDPSR